ncbi:MAG: hypothetical protein R2865_05985 [Deinococcales bacterium]
MEAAWNAFDSWDCYALEIGQDEMFSFTVKSSDLQPRLDLFYREGESFWAVDNLSALEGVNDLGLKALVIAGDYVACLYHLGAPDDNAYELIFAHQEIPSTVSYQMAVGTFTGK